MAGQEIKNLHDLLDGEEFFSLMQNYRITPVTQQGTVTRRFNAIKKFIADNFINESEATTLPNTVREANYSIMQAMKDFGWEWEPNFDDVNNGWWKTFRYYRVDIMIPINDDNKQSARLLMIKKSIGSEFVKTLLDLEIEAYMIESIIMTAIGGIRH